jgi:hypothetical protein
MEVTRMSKSRRSSRRRFASAGMALAMVSLLAATAPAAHALFHAVVIDEVLTSYAQNPDHQFIEMRMLSGSQNFVANSVFALFDAQGIYVDDLLVVPGNVGRSGAGTRWLVATPSFQKSLGVTADFLIADRALPTDGGMICFGGGGGISPQNPPSWDRENFGSYVDCLAYGTYSGPSNSRIGNPTPLNGNGHSLQRMTSTRDNATDFACSDDITAENNAGDVVDLSSTTSCSLAETPTATVANTATLTPTATTTPAPPIACVADCNDDDEVSVDEVVRAITIALATRPLDTCEEADPDGDGVPGIDELLRAVAGSVSGCAD